MATRRPKVPRATPTAPQQDASDGADVIRADFGGPKKLPAESPAAKTPTDSALKTASHPAAGRRAAGPRPANAGTVPTPRKKDSDDEAAPVPVPARAFSGRMLALTVVMIAIAVMLAPTVKIFIDKRAEIAALEADIASRQAEQDSLKQQLSRWQDPNYVKQQARDRINMVMPGETGYWVFGSDQPVGTSSGQTGAASAEDPANLPWVDSLWESIKRSATD
jgi:cell division protein FtsB